MLACLCLIRPLRPAALSSSPVFNTHTHTQAEIMHQECFCVPDSSFSFTVWANNNYKKKRSVCSKGPRERVLLRESDTQDNWLIKQAAACWGPWLSTVFHSLSHSLAHTQTHSHWLFLPSHPPQTVSRWIRNWRKYHGRGGGDQRQMESGRSTLWFVLCQSWEFLMQ